MIEMLPEELRAMTLYDDILGIDQDLSGKTVLAQDVYDIFQEIVMGNINEYRDLGEKQLVAALAHNLSLLRAVLFVMNDSTARKDTSNGK